MTKHNPRFLNYSLDHSWTLFLDRDGVLNKRIIDDYVRDVSQFEWLDGVKEALSILTNIFPRIFIVTNQRGIGRGLMEEDNLHIIFRYMDDELKRLGIKINAYYYCPHLANKCNCRKPLPGMAMQAKKEFPSTDFARSIMVGDSVSDIQFGQNVGMKTVFIGTYQTLSSKQINTDRIYPTLFDFAQSLNKKKI